MVGVMDFTTKQTCKESVQRLLSSGAISEHMPLAGINNKTISGNSWRKPKTIKSRIVGK